MSAFSGKTLMITGGTGSFGSTVLKRFLTTDIGQIRIFSRDEKKQDDMRHHLQAKYPDYASKVKFYIGDVRNIQSVKDAMPGIDYIFHATALKQVQSCEFFSMEAVRTNVEGTDNVLHAAIENVIKRVVCLSTDKAAYLINAMGISKAMMEHVIYANARVAAERGDTGTKIIGTRHGEKLYETLMTQEERLRSEDMGNYYRVAADSSDLNYDKYFVKGEVHTEADESYTSHNAKLLDVDGVVQKILTTDYIQEQLKEMDK